MALKLTQDMVGAIAYTLTVDGEVIEEIAPDEAIEYLHGAENLIPGLEKALEGKQAGDKFSVMVQPADGYGDYTEDDIEDVPLSEFDEADELEVGMEIEMVDDEGDVFEAIVLEVTDKTVKLDFNSPLAGKVLHYDVEVVNVREGTEDEVGMGIPMSLIEDFEDDDDYDDEDED
jgi:FKBP-type peptidyl-prolyl cis-trans isomerase SlyD